MTPAHSTPLQTNNPRLDRRPLIIAGLVLGLGQGAFFDGIIFHQLLQWHHMFSSVKTDLTVGGLEFNTLGDGLFHLLAWLLTLSGIVLLWRAVKRSVPLSTLTLIGTVLAGAGLFNLIEGPIDHHLLGIHHVKTGPYQTAYDLAFLLAGAILVSIGWGLVRAAARDTFKSVAQAMSQGDQ